MKPRFSGKTVFVTGASRGIGRAIARAFRAEDAWVIGTSTSSQPEANNVCQEWIIADFSVIDGIRACAEQVRRIGPDVLVNNAGINKIAPFVEITEQDFCAIHQVNVLAPFLLCQAALPAMKMKGRGHIVNVSSIWGKVSKEYRASYSASKFALDGLTVALAAEHSADGIIANSVAPGFIDTDLTRRVLGEGGIQSVVSRIPARRLGQADEIARLVLWLASEENSYVSGQNIAIDGGFSRV
jgi:3-oxoacyl-[acyl-carrier protein] reductase